MNTDIIDTTTTKMIELIAMQADVAAARMTRLKLVQMQVMIAGDALTD